MALNPTPPANTPIPAGQVQITLSPAFKLILLSVLGVTVLSLVVSLWLALSYENPPDHVKALLTTCTHAFSGGVGALFGLLGGKALL